MNSPGYGVNIDKMRETAKRAGAYSQAASHASQAADSVSVPPISWGAIGLGTVYPFYQVMLEGLKEHIHQMSEGFQSIEKKISSVADGYHQKEEDIKRTFKSIEDGLKPGGGSAGGTGSGSFPAQAAEAVNPDGGALS